MSTVPLKQQIINIELASDVVDFLGDGADSVYPQAGKHPGAESAKPFTLLVMGEETVVDPPVLSRQFFRFEVHDSPLQGYWVIDRIAERLRKLYEGWVFSGNRAPLYLLCHYWGMSGEMVADDWGTVYKEVRFAVNRM